MSQSGFEGVEKRLEVQFSGASPTASLRSIPKAAWDRILDFAGCRILSVLSNEAFCDAYLLSESSLFVYDSRIILKTCGTTVPIKVIPELLHLADERAMSLQTLYFTRKNFSFPKEQVFPHTSFEDEVDYLNKLFGGHSTSYMFGPVNGERWLMYVADYTEDVRLSVSPPTLELLMYDLDKTVMSTFFQNSENSVTARFQTTESKIDTIQPRAQIDDFAFSPCGYSMNALIDNGHSTIHITPEDGFSYVSFETTAPPTNNDELHALISRVLDVFKPGHFTLAYRIRNHSICPSLKPLANYKALDHTNSVVRGGRTVFFANYTADHSLPAFPFKVNRNMSISKIVANNSPRGSTSEIPATIKAEFNVASTNGSSLVEIVQELCACRPVEESFVVVDLTAILQRYQKARKMLPRAELFYPVSANQTKGVLKLLAAMDIGFDFATKTELNTVLGLEIPNPRLMSSNPAQLSATLAVARKVNVPLLSFDSVDQLQRLYRTYAENPMLPALLLRIAEPGSVAEQRHGAVQSEWVSLLTAATELKLPVVGVSIHASGEAGSQNYVHAITQAKLAFEAGKSLGLDFTTLDIGEGFHPSGDARDVADILDRLFPQEDGIRVICSPGCFLVESSHVVAANVFSRRLLADNSQNIFINDGVYGSFSRALTAPGSAICALPVATSTKAEAEGEEEEACCERRSNIFGNTGFSEDCIASQILLPDVLPGSWLCFPNMGFRGTFRTETCAVYYYEAQQTEC